MFFATPLLTIVLVAGTVSSAYVDLSHPINDNTLYWFKDKFESTPVLRLTDPHWVAINKFTTNEHGGTHIDAPYHFNEVGWKLGQIPLNRLFMVEGIWINKTEDAIKDPETQLTVKDLEDWVKTNGPLPAQCVVIVDFGWSKKYPDRIPYLGLKSDDDDLDRHFPSVSGEASKWLVDSGKVFGLGVDTASPDVATKGRDPVCHKTLTKHNIFILENLNLKVIQQKGLTVPARGFKLVILPINLQEGTGGPSRVILVTDEKKESRK